MGWSDMVTAALKFFGFVAEDVGKAQDAAHDTQMQQSGADQQKAASLDAAAKIARDQTAAIVNAPKTVDGEIDEMRKGGY